MRHLIQLQFERTSFKVTLGSEVRTATDQIELAELVVA